MGSISRGFRLAGASWRVVREDTELLFLPVISFVAMLLVSAVFALARWGSGRPPRASRQARGCT